MGVDFDPQVILRLQKAGKLAQYADAEDPEIPELLKLNKDSMIVSTIHEFAASRNLVCYLKEQCYEGKIALILREEVSEKRVAQLDVDFILRPYGDFADKVVEIVTPKDTTEITEKEFDDNSSEETES